MNKLLLASLIALPLIGCGGGGSGGSASTSTGGGATTPPSNGGDAIAMKTEDLVAPAGFAYDPVTSKTLIVDISSTSADRAQLSVYSDYSQDASGNYMPNFKSKVVSIPLDSGKGMVDVTLAEASQYYLAEVWFYDGTAPMQVVLNSDQLEWEWN